MQRKKIEITGPDLSSNIPSFKEKYPKAGALEYKTQEAINHELRKKIKDYHINTLYIKFYPRDYDNLQLNAFATVLDGMTKDGEYSIEKIIISADLTEEQQQKWNTYLKPFVSFAISVHPISLEIEQQKPTANITMLKGNTNLTFSSAIKTDATKSNVINERGDSTQKYFSRPMG